MRKIYEIDGPEIQVYPFETTYHSYRTRKKYKYRLEFIHAALSVPQLKFLEDKKWAMRPHPTHNPIQELFVEESDLNEQDWTMIGLLF